MSPIHTSELLYLNQLPVITQIDILKAELDSLRPISKEQEGRIMQKFRLDWNFNSNAIEGNSLDYGETVAFLMHGVTAKGKPLKDYLDIRGHNEAIDHLLHLIKNRDQLSERDVRELHQMLLVEPYDSPAQTQEGVTVHKRIKLGQYKTTPNHVRTVTGEIHYYATPEDTPILMGELIEWYREVTEANVLHPVVIAAVFHHRFASIHPFDDGNGRMSRLLMNLILMQFGYPPVIIRNDKKDEYYLVLSQADTGDLRGFVDYIGQHMVHSLELCIKGAKGESIEESLDLDKKIQLFKRELEARKDRVELRGTPETKQNVLDNSFKPLLNSYILMLSKFKDLFLEYEDYILNYRSDVEASTRAIITKWHYDKLDLMGLISDLSLSYFPGDVITICSNFVGFKLESNQFSLEIKLVLVFDNLEYRIYYTFSKIRELDNMREVAYSQWLGAPSVTKYYHQIMTSDEVIDLSTKIGNDLFEAIQMRYIDSSIDNIQIDIDTIKSSWHAFVDKVLNNNTPTYDDLKNVSNYSLKENLIVISFASEVFKPYVSLKSTLEDSFSKYLQTEGIVKARTLVRII